MDFKTAAKLGTYISKDYARDIFELLVNYRDISASEAASRLGLHIRTVQDFLEAFAGLGILEKTEVFEGKRPYFRYTLKEHSITMEIDLASIAKKRPEGKLDTLIREQMNASARFTTARNNQSIGSVTIWSGEGRDQKERRISLTNAQGRFLFHLPFPNARPLSIEEIMNKSGVEPSQIPEVLDIVDLLTDAGVIETP